MILWIVTDSPAFDRAVLLAPLILFPVVGLVYHTPFGSTIIQGYVSLVYAVSPFVDYILYFYDVFFESYMKLWDTPTRYRICASFGSLVYHLH